MDNTTGFANRTSLSDAKFKEKIGLAFLQYVKSDMKTHQNTFWLLRIHRNQLIPKPQRDPLGGCLPRRQAGLWQNFVLSIGSLLTTHF